MVQIRESLKSARRNLAEAIGKTSDSIFSRTRNKRKKMIRAINAIDRALVELKGL